uniref:Coronin-7 n=1 Tax=Syphacia muris TaxID=451379 RepID=A0A0N5AB79_9BILA
MPLAKLQSSRFVTTCKDRRIRVIDSHSGAVLHQGVGHEGVKPQRAVFLKDGRIFTTGFTKRSERLYALRSQDNLETPIIQEELDTSNGVLFPLYDEDTGLIYLAGKGDCAIRYYEVNNEYPFVHYINTYSTSEPQRGIGFMPKLGIDFNENEVARIYKVTTKGVVDELQFFVPRKSDLYQADLYPDTRSQVPALTAQQWIAGANATPNLTAVNPAASEGKPKIQVAKKANIMTQNHTTLDTATHHGSSPSHSAQRSPYETPQRSPHLEESHQPTRFEEPVQPQQRSPRKQPLVDDDMGIVRVGRIDNNDREQQQKERARLARSPEKIPQTMVPRQQVQLRSRSDRDNGATQTAGQRRATIELERIRRDHAREAEHDELLPPSHMSQASPRHSVIGVPSEEKRQQPPQPSTLEDVLVDLQKMKAILRQHERRIRLLEDQLADRNMADTYGF